MAVKKQRGLGRGLDVLLGKKVPEAAQAGAAEGLKEVGVNLLVPGKYQPRTRMDEASLAELSASIREQGVISPIVVRPVARGRYEIIAGERRFRAAKMADLKTVPVIVRKIGDSQALVMGLIENIQREDLNALEEAAGIERLVTEFGMTHETASKAVGKSRSQVTNLLRLLKLTEAVQELLMKDAITMGHARALLALDGAKQVQAAGEVVAKGLSVHETEKLVQAIQRGKTTSSRTKAVKTADTVKAENALADALGAPVEIRADKKGRGRLIIGFADFDALDGIMQRIVGP